MPRFPDIQFQKHDIEDVRLEKLRRLMQMVADLDRSGESLVQPYTPVWTAATSNPSLGNGSLTGRYSVRGKYVFATVRLAPGGTTTFGTGAWFFSLPFIPSSEIVYTGAAKVLDAGTNIRTGVVETRTDGTARCQVFIDSDIAAIDSAKPMTWVSGDILTFSLPYFAV